MMVVPMASVDVMCILHILTGDYPDGSCKNQCVLHCLTSDYADGYTV